MQLDGLHTTLLLAARAEGLPEIVHWGARLPHGDAASLRDRAPARNLLDDDIAEASVFPTLGAGLFCTPALAAHRDFPNSINLMTKGGHSESNACTGKIAEQLFRTGSEKGLDLSCLASVKLAPFRLP